MTFVSFGYLNNKFMRTALEYYNWNLGADFLKKAF